MLIPSIIAHILNGLLLFSSLLFVLFYFKRLQTVDTYRMLVLLLISSIAVGIPCILIFKKALRAFLKIRYNGLLVV